VERQLPYLIPSSSSLPGMAIIPQSIISTKTKKEGTMSRFPILYGVNEVGQEGKQHHLNDAL
jgi:hypothetical protein